ncbi:MAG TPA: oxidoreductase family protein [Acidimicrobiales bacterium]|nr:oxidoreductase family protein [Acidimicrobiales bacterium]
MSEALGATVVAVDATPIGVGVGLMGALCRVSVTYAEPTASRPATLIAKFPAEGDASRMVAELLGMYRKEVRFYEQLAKRAGIPHAECYYAELDDETQRFVLLLSDLANGRVVDQLEGCKLDDARLAVERLADLHASFWNDSEVATADWMGALCDSPFPEGVVFSYQTSWGPAQELFGDQMPPAIKDLGDRFDGLLPRIMQRLSEGPTTLSHGDYRLDNIFFYDTDLAVCDWQLVDRSRGARDLGYFLGGSLTAADRAAHERDLVAAYAARLAANGVANYDFATCWEDYRLAVLFSFVYGIVAAGGLDHGDPRGTAITGAMIERSVAAILELECLSLPEAAS